MAGELITKVFQWEYNGLLLGADTPFGMFDITGLGGYGAVQNGTVDRFGRHGGVGGQHYLGTREFVLSFDMVVADNSSTGFSSQIDMLYSAFAVRTQPTDELPLIMLYPGRTEHLFINCRPIDFNFPHDRFYDLKNPRVQIRMESTYPFIRCHDEKTFTISYTEVDLSGLDFALDFPLNFGPSIGSNETQIMNNGTAPGDWTATISGDGLVNPSITDSYSGRAIVFDGLTLGAGESITLDSQTRNVLLNGTSSRRHLLRRDSRWFKFPPKIHTGVTFLAENLVSNSQCQVFYHDTYWSI